MSKSSSDRYSLLDILRIIGGILLLNGILSYWFTSSTTWGYDGKWTNPKYIQFRLSNNYVNFTLAELSFYNGSDKTLPIYLAIDGRVYDVSASPHIYAARGPYSSFSGKDSARAFHTGCLDKADEFTYDLRGLDKQEACKDIRSWQKYFENHRKYWYAGVVGHEPIEGDPPAPCKHVRFPH